MTGRRHAASRLLAALALLALAPGCGEDFYHIGPIPNGIVRLDASLADVTGAPLGIARNTNADGLRVWLLEGGARADSQLTIQGAWAFVVKQHHSYRILAGVPPAVADTSLAFTPYRDAAFELDTLRLARRGDLTSAPNPFPTSVDLTFGLAGAEHVDLTIRDLGTRVVRSLMSRDLPAGLHRVTWDGRDDQGNVAHDGWFWAILSAPGDARAELIIKQP